MAESACSGEEETEEEAKSSQRREGARFQLFARGLCLSYLYLIPIFCVYGKRQVRKNHVNLLTIFSYCYRVLKHEFISPWIFAFADLKYFA